MGKIPYTNNLNGHGNSSRVEKVPLIMDRYRNRPEERRLIRDCWAAWQNLKAGRPSNARDPATSLRDPES